nr:uncharacterized mitochondrial protein AtMg00810-like [Tanacetum cinerariifolium]
MVQKSGIQCYNCKEYGHVARECQKPKRAKRCSLSQGKDAIIENFFNDDSIPFGVKESAFNMEEDILFLESLLREDPISPHPIISNQIKLLIEEPKHSFKMGNEHFNTNLVINDVAKSSTKNLIPIPHECKDSGFELTGFSDADYAGCKDTFKSPFGGAQFLGEKLVSWSLKKQDCTSLSTAKSEYVSLYACCAQVLWMRTQLTDYGYHLDKILIYCDSKSFIDISCNPPKSEGSTQGHSHRLESLGMILEKGVKENGNNAD